MQNNPILEIQNLKKYYPFKRGVFRKSNLHVKAVDDVSLSLEQGETLGLVGESGCGKTTLGRCVVRLDEPTSGRILFEGVDLATQNRKELKLSRRNIQVVFQDPFSSLNPRKTIEKIIGEGFIIHRLHTPQERREKIREIMDAVGLRPEQANRYPHEFSGGQRQRIAVARALALHPKLVIADEPVSALDVSIQAQILNLLVDLQQEFNLTYLFISHDLSVVRHICNRVAVMYLGHIVESASSHILFQRAAHPYTQALMQAVPIPDPIRKKESVQLEGDVPSPMNPPSGCPFNPRCRYSQEICREKFPYLEELETGHSVACHFPQS